MVEESKAFVRGPLNDASQELLNEAEQVIVSSDQINEENIYPENWNQIAKDITNAFQEAFGGLWACISFSLTSNITP